MANITISIMLNKMLQIKNKLYIKLIGCYVVITQHFYLWNFIKKWQYLYNHFVCLKIDINYCYHFSILYHSTYLYLIWAAVFKKYTENRQEQKKKWLLRIGVLQIFFCIIFYRSCIYLYILNICISSFRCFFKRFWCFFYIE